jgi:YedE family putative selenium metabolism protein
MLLRDESRTRNLAGIALLVVVGALAAALVLAGNPGNMGICGACFLRDASGALGLISKPDQRVEPKLSYLRPEIAGVVFGALAAALAGRRFVARSGSHAAARFALSAWMAIGALVFLGCPFRMLQRLGGGDANALVGLAGFVTGVFAALGFERRGYTIGRTQPVPAPAGLAGHALLLVLSGTFVLGGVLVGPGPGAGGPPPHAFWLTSLGLAGLAGVVLSATGFCAVSAARQLFQPRKAMLLAAVALVVGYAVVALVGGKFRASFAGQPVAHEDWLWNFAAMVLVGLCGALAGGCPVRQMVMAGEGNGDAFVALAGLVLGGAIAHDLGLASSAAGPTDGGKIAVIVGIVYAAVHAACVTRSSRDATA